MPIAFIASELQISKLNAAAAVRSLLPDLLTLRSPAVRPRGMGAAGRGAAAVYNVAGRLPGAAHRVFEPGDRRHQGSFRIGCDDLRILAAMMTNGEARVLVCLVLPCDRDKHGAPRRAQPIALGNDVLLSMVDIALLRRLVNAPVVRDRGVPNGIDYGAMTRLLELRLVDTGRLPDECGGMRRRCYKITAAGRAALEKNARAA